MIQNEYDLHSFVERYSEVGNDVLRQVLRKTIAWATLRCGNCSPYDTEELRKLDRYKTAMSELLIFMDTGRKPSGNFGVPESLFQPFLAKISARS